MRRRAFSLLPLTFVLGCTTASSGGGSGGGDDDGNATCLFTTDADQDGFQSVDCGGDDCEDRDPDVHPGMVEVPCDGLDNDCVDGDRNDEDADGHTCEGAGGDDCDDHDGSIHGGATDVWCDGVDQDCSGSDLVDEDGDGHTCEPSGGGDCDDHDPEVHPGVADPGMTLETIDSDGNVGSGSSIAIADDGTIHVAYVDASALDILYATYAGGRWTTSTIDSAGSLGPTVSLALSGGSPRVAYRVTGAYPDEHEIRIATRSGGGWSFEAARSGYDAGFAPTLAVDADGNAHVSVAGYSGYDVNYATDASGAWESTRISNQWVNAMGDVAVDADGAVHVVWNEYSYDGGGAGSDDVLRHATNATGVWTVEWIDMWGGFRNDPLDPSITIDGAGALHVVYSVEYGAEVRYATNASGAWSTEVVDPAGGVSPAIAVGRDGRVHVAYYDDETGDLRHAMRDDGTWRPGTVDAAGDTGRAPAIAVDADNLAHVVYYDATDGDLRHAIAPDGIDDDCSGVADDG